MSVFPFISPEQMVSSTVAELPLFREYAYDFSNNALLLKEGNTYLVEGNEALRIWIYKAIRTVRYRHIAYTKDYGCEIDTLIGNVMSSDILTSEMRRFIVEAVMVNPYVKELNDFLFTKNTSGMTVSFTCLSVYGRTAMQLDIKGVGS